MIDEDTIDLILDIVADRARLWPLYRCMIRLGDVPIGPLSTMLLWMEARHRGIWTSQVGRLSDQPFARLPKVQDPFEQIGNAVAAAEALFRIKPVPNAD